MEQINEMNEHERQLLLLIAQARRLPHDDLEPCKDWSKQEMMRAKKLYQKIDQLQKSPKIGSKMFNQARDCCDMLTDWMKRLEMNSIQTNCRTFNSLTELGMANKSSTTY